MLLSTDSIISILSVLVALPPSILIIVTVVRHLHCVPRHTSHNQGRCQYNSAHPNLSTSDPPFAPTIYYATNTFQLSQFDLPARSPDYSSGPRRMRPVSSIATLPFADQTLIQSPPPTYQPPVSIPSRLSRQGNKALPSPVNLKGAWEQL